MSHCIKPGYVERERPEYSHDADAHGFQPHVYDLAVMLARLGRASGIVDIGCGAGEKLAAITEFMTVGWDYGENIRVAHERHPERIWREIDLETVRADQVCIAPRDVIVCADVIEHLMNPEPLLIAMREWLRTASCAVLSTPERVLCYGRAHNGPPPNPAHVREWTRVELVMLLNRHHLDVAFSGFTQTHEAHPETGEHQGCQTTVVVLKGATR